MIQPHLKKKVFWVCVFLMFGKAIWSQTETLPAQISAYTYYNCDTLLVSDTVHIHPGAELHIDGHTQVVFTQAFPIWVNGTLKVTGDSLEPVIFSPIDTTGWHDTTTYAGAWPGIRLFGTNPLKSVIISNARFLFAKNIGLNEGKGGALYARNSSEVTISGAEFSYCSARRGGAIYMRKVSQAQITNSIFNHNILTSIISTSGNAVHLADSVNSIWFKNNFELNGREMVYAYDSTLGTWVGYATGCVFKSTAENGLSPATHTSNHKIESNTFINNYASASVIDIFSRFVFIYNNLILNSEGSGISGDLYARGIIANNLIANNTGPAIISNTGNLKYYCNILWNNFGNSSSFADFQNANYNISQFALPGTGNTSEMPEFENPVWAYGIDTLAYMADWKLRDTSPGINAGTPDTSGLFLPNLDAWGNARISFNRMDIGPFELPEPGNINELAFQLPKISAFPSPCVDALWLNLPYEMKSTSVLVFSIVGTPFSLPLKENRLDVSELPAGSYKGLFFQNKQAMSLFSFTIIR